MWSLGQIPARFSQTDNVNLKIWWFQRAIYSFVTLGFNSCSNVTITGLPS